VLGVGAQKAGTTWLWKLICTSDFAQTGKKEYHFLNTLEARHLKRTRDAEYDISGIQLTNPSNFETCIKDYVFFFKKYLDNSSQFHTGEITPAYAMLKSKTFLSTREILLENGLNPRLVFIVRNPVDRIISHFNMEMKRNNLTFPSQQAFEKALIEFSCLDRVISRTQYKKTLDVLNNVFDPREIYVGLYEEMFTPEKISELSHFLELTLDQNLHSTKVNESQQTFEVSKQGREIIIDRYRETYLSMNELFPKTKELWNTCLLKD
jgi:hypothetical protein